MKNPLANHGLDDKIYFVPFMKQREAQYKKFKTGKSEITEKESFFHEEMDNQLEGYNQVDGYKSLEELKK